MTIKRIVKEREKFSRRENFQSFLDLLSFLSFVTSLTRSSRLVVSETLLVELLTTEESSLFHLSLSFCLFGCLYGFHPKVIPFFMTGSESVRPSYQQHVP